MGHGQTGVKHERIVSYPAMLRSFTDFVCGNETLAFESDFGLQESVRRLAAEIRPPLMDLRPVVSGRGRSWIGRREIDDAAQGAINVRCASPIAARQQT